MSSFNKATHFLKLDWTAPACRSILTVVHLRQMLYAEIIVVLSDRGLTVTGQQGTGPAVQLAAERLRVIASVQQQGSGAGVLCRLVRAAPGAVHVGQRGRRLVYTH